MNVLEEANQITSTDRQQTYGHPLEDFARTATFWSQILHTAVRAEDVALCMIALKLSREVNAHKRDNLVDIAGYARTLELVVEEKLRN